MTWPDAFSITKWLSQLTQPMFWVALLLLASWVLIASRPRLARFLVGLTLVCVCVLGWPWLANRALIALEHQYALPVKPLSDYAGMIVLGGAFEHYQMLGRDYLVDGLVTPGQLMRGTSNWYMVFSGGSGSVNHTGPTESDFSQAYFLSQGLNMGRIGFDNAARNTHESAINVARLLGSRCRDQEWLLVTSAAHMVRSMYEFESQGCSVSAYPVNFQGVGGSDHSYLMNWATTLPIWQKVLHERLGFMLAAWRAR